MFPKFIARRCERFFFIPSYLLLSSLLFSQGSEFKIIAHYKEKVEDRIYATGNVEIHYKDLKLFADKVEVSLETKDVYAEGNVVIQMANEVMSADNIRFNLESKVGELENVQGMVQPTVFYEAESIEKKEENLYHLEKARITSCTQPVPRWNFRSSKANFKKEDYVEMWSAVLSIKKVPVFYFPYIRYPVGREKATGFLTPQLGYNGQKGMTFSQGFYWDIRRNMDATLNFDYFSYRGFGGGLEYRYLFPKGIGGQFNLFFFNFKTLETGEKPESAYILRMEHSHPLPLGFNLVADVDYQSSFDFLREFDNNFKRAVVSNRRSQVYLSRAWSYFNLYMRTSRFETYFRQTDRAIIRKNLPEVSLSSSKIKVISPLYFSFSSSFNRWEHGWGNQYEADTQKRSQSLGFSPALNLPFTAIPWLTLNSSLSSNFILYFQSYAAGTKNIVGEPLLQKNFDVNFELIGPVFYKIYFGSDDEPRMKHIVEPSFSYRYESPVGNADRIITQTFFSRNHYFQYGITNRFLIKHDGMPREVFTFGLNQTYYLAPEEGPLQIYTIDGEIPEFSDIRSYLRFYPSRKYSIDFSAGLNPYTKTFSSLRLGANLATPNDPVFLRINWFKSINPYYEEMVYQRHQIGFFGGVKIPRLSVEAQAEVDFNIHERELLYSAFMLKYQYQCIDFMVDFRVFYFRDQPEVQFRINFGLGQIGKTTDILGGLGF